MEIESQDFEREKKLESNEKRGQRKTIAETTKKQKLTAKIHKGLVKRTSPSSQLKTERHAHCITMRRLQNLNGDFCLFI